MRKNAKVYTGVDGSRSARLISGILEEGRQGLVIVSGRNRAEALASDLSFFCDRNIHILPPSENVFLQYEARSKDSFLMYIKAVKAVFEDPQAVIVAPASAIVKVRIPKDQLLLHKLSLSVGDSNDPMKVRKSLDLMGYERENIVFSPGQFAFRGGIIDIFAPDAELPYRVEFFGNEIDSIRKFDPETQRSMENMDSIMVSPASSVIKDEDAFARASEIMKGNYRRQYERLEKNKDLNREALYNLTDRAEELAVKLNAKEDIDLLEHYIPYLYEKPDHFSDYMENPLVIAEDPSRIKDRLDLRYKELTDNFQILLKAGMTFPEDAALIESSEDLDEIYNSYDVSYILPMESGYVPGESPISKVEKIKSRQIVPFSGHMDLLEEEVKKLAADRYDIVVSASSDDREKNLKNFFADAGLASEVRVVAGSLTGGMLFPDEKLCIISDSDIFSTVKKKKRSKKKKSVGQRIQSFTDLKTGDYVVHEYHGIGRFLGIEALTMEAETKDYIKISYAGDDLLYVPVEQMDIVQKYIGSSAAAPKINRLTDEEWKNTKAKAKAAVAEMTRELVELYAERKAHKSYAFSPDTVWQEEFEAAFPYEETDDQLKAVEEIKADMESDSPMDRLLCGDVGYGKTEVAARAIFKCLVEGKQAAMLVPTTILASQHFKTFSDRFRAYPFKVEMLSRFRSPKEQKEITDGLKKGSVDFIIGTHRLLSEDINFKDLGLLVIDEEQRFGVAAKERIKSLKTNVDVLTLSATPIPRTLNMSLTGIRDMSLITEPPGERHPVETYVVKEDDILIRSLIEREMERQGQVFVVYNRVQGIERIAGRVKDLVPDARVLVGHGRMKEEDLEDVMQTFIDGEADVLVSTTIVESGLDIPNANTMIVIDADKFGLSQLYQLRGRVGRSNRIAYAYLMYRRGKILSEIAEKRLKAIKEFTEFGSGFKIAMRDLEIRGAGNLLGAEQSGNMVKIGYELYCKIVDDAVKEAKGEKVPDRTSETNVEIKVNANIPDWYISNESLKLQQYKKIALIENAEDQEDLTDELIDRFGDIPEETMNLIKVSRIRSLAINLGFIHIYDRKKSTYLTFDADAKVNPYGIMKARSVFGSRLFFHGGSKPYIKLDRSGKKYLDDVVELLQILYDYQDFSGEDKIA